MKKKVSILIILFAFFFSGSALADPSVDVRITNRTFSENDTLTFDVELRAGTEYRLNGAADGDWTGMAIRIDIYGESGLTYNIPPPATPTTHDMASMNVSPTGITYGEYNITDAPAAVTKTVAVIATRSSSGDDTEADLGSTWVRVATISIHVTGGVPTDETLLILRNTDHYLPIRSAFWSNGADFNVRRPLNQILPPDTQSPDIPSPEIINVSYVSVSPNMATIAAGSALQLTTTVAPASATDKSLTWTSGNESIATVDQTGNVSCLSEGVAVITATANNGIKSSCTVTVVQIYNRVLIDVPLRNAGWSMTFGFDIPAGVQVKGSFALTLPKGLEIEIENITLTESLSEGLEVTVNSLENNTWLFEISSEERNNSLRNITCEIDEEMSDTYEVILKDEDESVENVPNFELVLKADETANVHITKEVNVFIANGILTIDTPDAETVKVYNTTGILVYMVEKQAGKVTYPVSGLSNGIYFVAGSNGWVMKISKR